MKQFINVDLMAPNVLRVSVDLGTNSSLLQICSDKLDSRNFAQVSPDWDSDIRWVSARSPEAFSAFQSEFDRLGIAAHVEPYLDLDKAVRLFSGFLVERSFCRGPNFHLDWINTNNEAFTFLTPLTGNSDGFGLLYKRIDGTTGEYAYKIGEALIIGDGFVHSTKPGRSTEPVVLLSFTFGTDKMEHWKKIARTAANQGELTRRPDGAFQRISSGSHFRKLLGRVARAAVRSFQPHHP